MKLFDLLGKKNGEDTDGKNRRGSDLRELEIYSGMRVVVESLDGRILFIAKLQDPQRNTAKLYQYSDTDIYRDTDNQDTDNRDVDIQDMDNRNMDNRNMDKKTLEKDTPAHVKIRGYNEDQRKAVFMDGVISSSQKHIWEVENLIISRIENERSFARLNVDLDATVASSDGAEGSERACRLLNISIGGAGISSEHRYHKGDKFLLKARLSESGAPSVMFCEVLRVIERDSAKYEYGCRFIELTEADQEQIESRLERMGFLEENR